MKPKSEAYSVGNLIIVLLAILFPIIAFPKIYGVDAFQILWTSQAIRNCALISGNTWLIHPTSYFGMYPYSHRPIGFPLFPVILIYLFTAIPFGVIGIVEVVFVYDLFLVLGSV